MKQIIVIAEIFQGLIRPVTWELAGTALRIAELEADSKYLVNDRGKGQNDKKKNIRRQKKSGNIQLQKELKSRIRIIVPGEDPLPVAEKIAEHTSMDVICLKIKGLETYDCDAYKTCLFRVISEMDVVSHVLIAHTSQGRDFGFGLGVKLNAASISGVNSIFSDDDGLVYSRAVYGNEKNMMIRPAPDIPVVLTIMPGMFRDNIMNNLNNRTMEKGKITVCEIPFNGSYPLKKTKPVSDTGVDTDSAEVENIHVKGKLCQKSTAYPCQFASRIIHGQILRKACGNKALKGAKIIVSAGRGIGEKDGLKEIFEFAECFSSSAVGASRPLVDMGWIGYDHQVGITGAEVSPRLYIACGISGSSQHIAGMKGSEIVVSINKNPDAPIFRHSDICIIADVHEFIKEFLKQR